MRIPRATRRSKTSVVSSSPPARRDCNRCAPRSAQAVSPQQAIERRAIDPRFARGDDEIAAVTSEEILEVAPLEMIEPRLPRVHERPGRVDHGQHFVLGAMLRRILLAQRKAAFQIVSQLANVARPRVL